MILIDYAYDYQVPNIRCRSGINCCSLPFKNGCQNTHKPVPAIEVMLRPIFDSDIDVVMVQGREGHLNVSVVREEHPHTARMFDRLQSASAQKLNR